jgi:hypothetical protein
MGVSSEFHLHLIRCHISGFDDVARLLIRERISEFNEMKLSCKKFCNIFQHSPSHRIFGRMHEVLNIDKKQN